MHNNLHKQIQWTVTITPLAPNPTSSHYSSRPNRCISQPGKFFELSLATALFVLLLFWTFRLNTNFYSGYVRVVFESFQTCQCSILKKICNSISALSRRILFSFCKSLSFVESDSLPPHASSSHEKLGSSPSENCQLVVGIKWNCIIYYTKKLLPYPSLNTYPVVNRSVSWSLA